jgi:hypothetical protein
VPPRALPHCPHRVHVLPSIFLRRNPWVEPVETGSGETIYYTLRTTHGRQAVRCVNAYCSRDDSLDDLRPATRQEVAAF